MLETQVSAIEAAFQEFTERKDIAILLINQHVWPCSVFRGLQNLIYFPSDCREDPANGRQVSASISSTAGNSFQRPSLWCVHPSPPATPSDCKRSDPSKDSVLKRVQKLFGD